MAETKYCLGCMQPLSWDGRCRFCDFRLEEYRHEEHQLPLRSTLKNGEYLVGRVLGEGGFGITYIGLDTTLLQPVAIKEFYPKHLVKRNVQNDSVSYEVLPIQETQRNVFERGIDSFLREGRILVKFSSLNAVVGVKTLFKENGTAYLVMDYVDGMSVKEYVHAFGTMEPQAVLSMIKPVIRDLQCMHEEHIFHRDISADNLIINTNGKLTLIDFGAARLILSEEEKTNTILYKPGYSALEQYSANGRQGGWTDVYGLCASVYYMLTGIVPESAMERMVDDQMLPLCDMESVTLEEKTKEALWKGMAVEPVDRYQNMAELYQVLYGERISELVSTGGKGGLMPRRDISYSVREKVLSHTRMKRELMEISRNRERKNCRRRWVLGLAGAIILCIGAVVWLGMHGMIPTKWGLAQKVSESGSGSVDTAEPVVSIEPSGNQTEEPVTKQTAEPREDQTEEVVTKQTAEPREDQTEKPKAKRTPKPKKKPSATPKVKATTKPKVKQTSTPKSTVPSLRLQEDDHVAGDLRSLE